MMEFLRSVGAFVRDPGPGTATAFAYILCPFATFVAVQRLKRLTNSKMTAIELELLAFTLCAAISLLLLMGKYHLPLADVWVDAILISTLYTSIVAWGMAWAKEHNPDLYRALKTDRRSMDDTQEIKIGQVDGTP